MKKIFLFISIMYGFLAFLPSTSLAANVLDPACEGVSDSTLCNENKNQDVKSNGIYGTNGILAKTATVLSIVVGIVCVIAIIIGGLRYVLSGGDTQQTANAKNAILYAIIGLVITIAARSILVFVLGRIK